ncbi:MAG TPA: RAQPRD family integrative conjugative element protein, partial [Ramlibacter sp.]|nr:RAQPRD family integrative conjugative element protein [Ramlibacter sp.]
QAAKNADTTARVKFRYDWLGKDLDLVLRGVTDHLDAPRQPRPVPPLVGDYRR